MAYDLNPSDAGESFVLQSPKVFQSDKSAE